ncbi:MAG: type IV pilin N-terminal domain-containing protein [Methanocorpusculum sp.]|nr:type IV pilin N-terminal domain-containing protein [Methanocorpusculum sp.]
MVTIIIAAVVSGFAGNLISGQSATPSAVIETTMTPHTLVMKVISVSEPIDTNDVKIVVSGLNHGKFASGTLEPGDNLYGFGKGITDITNGTRLGDYMLYGGTGMKVSVSQVWNGTSQQNEYPSTLPFITNGENSTTYILDAINLTRAAAEIIDPDDNLHTTWNGKPDTAYPDHWKLGNSDGAPDVHPWAMVLFNKGWSAGSKNPWKIKYTEGIPFEIEKGDKFNVKMIYTPSGQAIYSSDVIVKGD